MLISPVTLVDLEDGRWRVLCEATRDPATGKRRRLAVVVPGDRRDAERAARELAARPEADLRPL